MDEVTSETPKRNSFEPWGVTCPEGIWCKEAAIQFLLKENPEAYGKLKFPEVVKSLIKFLLTTPEMEVFTVNSLNGEKQSVDREFLRSRSAIEYFIKGLKPFSSDFHVSDTDGYFFFLDREHFENFLADRPIVDPPEVQQSESVASSYIPPYMQYMLKAAAALELSHEKRTGKSVIVDWLRQNWPADLEGKSDRIIDSMATMLRSPEHKKGGNTSWKE